MRTLKIIITGRVQGVGFRFFLRQKAQLLDIKGYARNNSNGSLEVVAQSDNKDNLKNFLKECNRGPILASVSNVDISEEEDERTYPSFDIR